MKLKNYNDPKIMPSKHVGHNVIDHLTFIVDNYENLPKTIAFIKGNIVGKYLNQQDWESLISRDSYTFLYNNRNLGSKELVQRRIHSGAVLEENTDWYIWNSPHKYFLHYNDMLNFLFEDAISSNFVLFSPGGGYIVEKERILRYPKSFYQGLIKILDYDFFPSESYILERMMHIFFDGDYKLRPHCNNLEDFYIAINNLPDNSLVSKPRKLTVKTCLKHPFLKIGSYVFRNR